MFATSELVVRAAIVDYLAGRRTLREFTDWFAPRAWASSSSDPMGADSLVADVDLLLAEHTSGDWTEAELREHLAALH